jgi:hypothetical protein
VLKIQENHWSLDMPPLQSPVWFPPFRRRKYPEQAHRTYDSIPFAVAVDVKGRPRLRSGRDARAQVGRVLWSSDSAHALLMLVGDTPDETRSSHYAYASATGFYRSQSSLRLALQQAFNRGPH